MKTLTKKILQTTLGFNNYLRLFSLFKIYTLPYDKGENDFLKFLELIKREGIILDIGANIGLMTVTMAKHFPNSSVLSFEPVPDNLDILKRNISYFKLKNVKVFDIALGNENGNIEMVMPEVDHVKMHGLCHVIHQSMPKESSGNKFSVPLRTLDGLVELQEDDRPVVGIKMDVEHFEWAVLEGAKNTINKHKPVIYIELANNRNRYRSLKTLHYMGYAPFVVEGTKLVHHDPNKHQHTNFIFIHKSMPLDLILE